MPGYYTITYVESGRTSEYAGTRGNYYEFDDGSTIGVKSRPVWCKVCKAVTDGEWIESVEELKQEIEDLTNPDSWLFQFHEQSEEIGQLPGRPPIRFGFRENALKIARERLTWRTQRRSPPKCLTCGSENIFHPDADDNVFVDGLLVVRIESCGMCSTEFRNWFFTPEGQRIPRGTKPTYWAIPDPEQ
jgi:hypothetical protein